jgi:hypothetical protein
VKTAELTTILQERVSVATQDFPSVLEDVQRAIFKEGVLNLTQTDDAQNAQMGTL